VSGCPTHGELVGGYALGALEPDEMEEMRRHVAVCPHCGPEIDRLAALPGLLDRIAPADVPPPSLSPQVEEAVLDRVARERREEAARGAADPRVEPSRRGAWLGRAARADRGAAPPRRRDRGPALAHRSLALAAACVLALAVAFGVVLAVGGGDDEAPAYARVSLDATVAGSGSATAELDEVPAGTRIRLETRGLRSGSQYEVWCIRSDGHWVSGGTFRADRDGRVQAELTAAVRPGDYHRMVVTEGAGDAARGPAVLRGALQY
jgi:anti-sigma-K factor RskA